ncbi:hypothetical protein [Ensifer adhaerens]|uniref:hypothetical protein n=1 Tax=Ensifer adhaerens TaxID=106592 RepID=UPI00132F1865|nr:hypothetical protein [Ensifer adhaerens]QHG74322.1 hypothetical protein DQW09_31335 [Ensifer adhaerens]
MSDCDKLHPAFRNLETIEEAHRRRLSPSLVEAVAMAVVLLLLLATNFDRWTGSANAPSKVPLSTRMRLNSMIAGPLSCPATAKDSDGVASERDAILPCAL